MKNKAIDNLIKYPILFYILYFIYTIRPPFRLMMFSGNRYESLIHYGLIAWGVLIVVYNFWKRKYIFSRNKIFIGLWIILSLLTILTNLPLITMESIKSIILTILSILYFVIGYPLLRERYTNMQIFKYIFYPVLGVKIVINIISIYLYLANISIFVVKGETLDFLGLRYVWIVDNIYTPLLYGLYKDPNFSAMMGATLIIMALYIYIQGSYMMKRFEKVFVIISIVLEFLIISFSNSRGTLYSSILTGLIVIIIYTIHQYKNTKSFNVRRIVFSCLSILVLFISYEATQRVGFLLSQNSDYKRYIYVDKNNSFERISEEELEQDRYENNRGWILEYQVSEDEGKKDSENDKKIVTEKHDSGEELGNGRLSIWIDAIKLFSKKPIFGIGPEMQKKISNEKYDSLDIPSMKEGRSIHNSYLSVLLYYGIIATLVLAIWLIKILLPRLKGEIKEGYSEKSILFYGVIFTLLVSIFLESIFINIDFQQIWLMFIIGMLSYEGTNKYKEGK